MRGSQFVLSSACVVLLAGDVSANTVTLTPVKDNTIRGGGNFSSNGQGPLFVGRTGSFGTRRGLIAFSVLDSIPSESVIESVELTLFMNKTTSPARLIRLHRLLSDWGEGASNSFGGGLALAQPGDATWAHTFFDSLMWTNPGGDFVAVESAVLAVDQPGPYTWTSTAELVADVQQWVDDPSTNFGWILIGDENFKSAKRFDSRHSSSASNRPKLTIQFMPRTFVERSTWGAVKELYRE